MEYEDHSLALYIAKGFIIQGERYSLIRFKGSMDLLSSYCMLEPLVLIV